MPIGPPPTTTMSQAGNVAGIWLKSRITPAATSAAVILRRGTFDRCERRRRSNDLDSASGPPLGPWAGGLRERGEEASGAHQGSRCLTSIGADGGSSQSASAPLRSHTILRWLHRSICGANHNEPRAANMVPLRCGRRFWPLANRLEACARYHAVIARPCGPKFDCARPRQTGAGK